jgi:hypothetical protein
MAFPGTYNINYYKGDTYQFRVYPKKPDGLPFPLTSYNLEDDPLTTGEVEGVIFAFAQSRGGSSAPGWHKCLAEISDEGDYVLCTIRPEDGLTMDASKDYVYDVQVRKPGVDYPQVLTLLTGTINVTEQVADK